MMNQLLLLIAVFIGINSTVYLVQYNNLKKTELQYQENEKQREHEKELTAIKILGKEYILDQIQKGNITFDYGERLKETMNSSFVPDQMEEDEKAILEYTKVNFSEDMNNHKNSMISISDQLEQFSNKRNPGIKL